MKTITTAIALTGLTIGLLAPVTAQAQAESESIAQVYIVSVKQGSGPAFEAAFKGYLEWRKAHGDSWTWLVSQAVNGDALGQYVILSPGHQWADLDSYDDPDPGGAQFFASAGPHIDSIVSRISQTNAALSNLPADLSEFQMFRVTSYEVRDQAAFMASVAKFHAAAQQTNWPGLYGFSTIFGGPLTMNVLLPARNWAGFAPPETPVPQMLTEAYGEDGAAELFETFASSWRSASSATWQARPDLSLVQMP